MPPVSSPPPSRHASCLLPTPLMPCLLSPPHPPHAMPPVFSPCSALAPCAHKKASLSFLYDCTVVDDSSVQRKTKTPAHTNNALVKNKCTVPLEPLDFNVDRVTPAKRRASRSVPDESSVTPKRSKGGSQSTKKAKEPVLSPRQRFGMY